MLGQRVQSRKDVKDLSVALMSTAALLLTILSVVRIRPELLVGPVGPEVVFMAVGGLFFSILFGSLVFLSLVEYPARLFLRGEKFLHLWFLLQLWSFILGLAGILVVVLMAFM